MKRHLLVFARYPEVGKCKTRLIPELGDVGAAEVHEAMTQHTLCWAREIQKQTDVTVEVRFAGGDEGLMAEKFGADLRYVPQCEGCLGARLTEAFQQNIDSGAEQIVVVGTDCPQLSANFCQSAFDALQSTPIAIAPAMDGGYTLLGAKVEHGTLPFSALFEDKNWGTESVLSDTVDALANVNVHPRLLPALSDVDFPEDLPVWEQARSGISKAKPEISVIVPVFGIEPNLQAVIESAASHRKAEVILCATGEMNSALKNAVANQVQFIPCSPPRARQMNLGAAEAQGDVLLFLHADTELPKGYGDLVQQSFDDPNVIGGAFRLHINTDKWIGRLVEWGVSCRSRWRQLPYGDQAIYVKRDAFESMSGYPDQEIMEDYVFAKKSRKFGRLCLLPASARTSGRRWERLGFIRTTLVNQLMILGYRVGIADAKLARFYRGQV